MPEPRGVVGTLARSEAADRLKEEAQAYLTARAESVLAGVGRRLGEATVKLNDIAEGRSPGFGALALEAGRKITAGKGPLRSAAEIGGGRLKDTVTSTVKNALSKGTRGKGSKGGGRRPTVVLEHVDVGVPVREAYDQWTRFEDFATFAKGVQDVTVADDTSSDWRLKVFWSKRSWRARTTEQVPDRRIAWTTEGAKGTTKGVVTFHPLADGLTRVLLVIEYYPKGLFERTGNIWRAQGRRARLDLKHYARHIALRGEAAGDGRRQEIRDGEVVAEDADEERDEDAYEDQGADDSDDSEDRYADDEDVDEDADEEAYDEPEAEHEADDEDAYEEPGDDEVDRGDEADDEVDRDDEADEADEADEVDDEADRDDADGRGGRRRAGGRGAAARDAYDEADEEDAYDEPEGGGRADDDGRDDDAAAGRARKRRTRVAAGGGRSRR